jgi:hypothetical protein
VAAEAGVTNRLLAKAVVWGDFDADRYPDIYVSNYEGPNRLYRNRGNGTFEDVAVKRAVSEPWESFPAWFWDFDNDGAVDIFASAYSGGIAEVAAFYLNLPFDRSKTLPRLYRGDGNGGFQEVASRVNLVRPLHAMGANFGDLDNDGFLDCYFGTGWPEYHELMPNVMYLNARAARFRDVTTAGGFGHLQKGHAVVFADLDNDGDQDIFEQMGGFVPGDRYRDALYENPGSENHWICVKLSGTRTNRAGIGARIHVRIVENGRRRSIYRHVNSGGSFGANSLRQSIGLGSAEKIERCDIFSAGGLKYFFFPVSYLQKPSLDQFPNIAGVEPAVFVDHFIGEVLSLVIAQHDIGALAEDLSIFAKLYCYPFNHRADGAKAHAIRLKVVDSYNG